MNPNNTPNYFPHLPINPNEAPNPQTPQNPHYLNPTEISPMLSSMFQFLQSGMDPRAIQNNHALFQQMLAMQQATQGFPGITQPSPSYAPTVTGSQQDPNPSSQPNENASSKRRRGKKPMNEKSTVRPPNWRTEEDVDLCKSWIRISTDSETGNNQDKLTFWNRVWEEFLQRRGRDMTRNEQACESRWGLIHPWVTKWTAIWRKTMEFKPSGFTIQDQEHSARTLFQNTHHQPFKHEHCWVVLRSSPKWHQYSAESKIGIELGLDKQGPFHDLMEEWDLGGAQEIAFNECLTGATSADNNTRSHHLKTPGTDGSPFQASNGPEGNGTAEASGDLPRPVGSKAAKAARARKKTSRGDGASQVSESINAGFTGVIETSHRNWNSYMKTLEERRQIKEENDRVRAEEDRKKLEMLEKKIEEERVLTIVAKKSKIYRNKASITSKLFQARKQLREMLRKKLTEPDEFEELEQLQQMVKSFETQLEELEDVSQSESGSPARRAHRNGRPASTSNGNDMRYDDDDWLGRV